MCMNTTDKTTLPYMTLAEITEAAGGTYHGDPALLDQAVTGVTIDSRQARPGCLYVPFKGARVDGHSFIPQVMEAGALCALTEEDLTGDAASATHIRVGSTEKALRDLAEFLGLSPDSMRLADGTLVTAIVIQQGRRLIVLRQQEHVFRLDLGASVLDLFNTLRRKTGDQITGLFTGEPKLFPGCLPDGFIFFR